MAKDPAFPFYAQDYLIDTLRWDREMKSLHVDLLAESWINGPLDNFNAGSTGVQPAFPVGLNSVDQSVWQRIKHKWVFMDGKWVNVKLEEVRTARKTFRKLQSDRGKLSAEARKNKKNNTQPAFNQRSTTVEPVENEYEKGNEKKNKKESSDFYEVDVSGDELIFPIDTPVMRQLWAAWKEARWVNYGLAYGMHGEQAALKQLEGMNFHEAQAAIQQAIAGKWKNLYPEKNGKRKSLNDSKSRIDEIVKHRFGAKGAG